MKCVLLASLSCLATHTVAWRVVGPTTALRGRSRTLAAAAGANWDPASDAEAAEALGVTPLDASNLALLDAVHPVEWEDPTTEPGFVYDLVVIGAGAGGLVSSKQAARRGARSCLISEALAGGDCLNVGCVPSKALLRAARAVREVRRCAEFGVVLSEPPRVDFAAIMRRLRAKRAEIAPVDSHAATTAVGADVYQGRGRFTGPHTVEVNGRTLRFRKAVLATGGSALVPPVPGLAGQYCFPSLSFFLSFFLLLFSRAWVSFVFWSVAFRMGSPVVATSAPLALLFQACRI